MGGQVAAGFETVQELFEQEVAQCPGTGCAFALWRDGVWVADLWGGYADEAGTRAWTAETLAMPYSVTKPLAAVCVLLLADRRLVELDAPMHRYWPELGGDATVRQVLSHSAGYVLLEEPAPTEAFFDWEQMVRLIEQQRPLWPPGTQVGESALIYGHLLGQLVRRVDGRSLGTFLRQEVCEPHGIDFHVGVPDADLARVADLTGLGADVTDPGRSTDSLMARALSNPPGALDRSVVNSTRWRRAEVPAINGHGTAHAVARFYASLATGDLLSEAILREMTSVQASGFDRVAGDQRSWGLGVAVDSSDGWGMGGVGGSLGWWSEAGQYAVGFVAAHLPAGDLETRLENVVRTVLGLPEI